MQSAILKCRAWPWAQTSRMGTKHNTHLFHFELAGVTLCACVSYVALRSSYIPPICLFHRIHFLDLCVVNNLFIYLIWHNCSLTPYNIGAKPRSLCQFLSFFRQVANLKLGTLSFCLSLQPITKNRGKKKSNKKIR